MSGAFYLFVATIIVIVMALLYVDHVVGKSQKKEELEKALAEEQRKRDEERAAKAKAMAAEVAKHEKEWEKRMRASINAKPIYPSDKPSATDISIWERINGRKWPDGEQKNK